MAKKLVRPFLICLVLTALLAYGLHLLLLYSFFDSRTRNTVLVCLGLLFAAVWLGFLAEARELFLQHRAAARARAEEAERQRRLETEALSDAAQLLNGLSSAGDKPASPPHS